ncbi:transglutaminase-like domain-containing protein [Pseudokineococcus lusitanus]|uniref:Transglutaminase superfamily protein n=1 Tax=Pseudokineococcus lusitanus TaxID=763993 RepID=A0A3N1HKW1_9ACTN|nr:transglutaminase-like domain-containing protein [Pseudokineococcus lusitanus]ROP43099.1 transglutaminase superfamily protein [Pseudokineococcus lusitanus]
MSTAVEGPRAPADGRRDAGREPTTAVADPRRLPAAWAAGAVVAASTALLPLVDGLAWAAQAWALVVVVTLVGVVLDVLTASVLVRTAVQLVVVVAALTALFAPATGLLGLLPGPATPAALGGLLLEGREVVRRSVPPVPDLPGLRLLVVAGVAAVALVVDLLAVRLGRATLAGVPLLALAGTGAALAPGGLAAATFVATAAAWLALLAAQARCGAARWGRAATRRGDWADEPSRAPGAVAAAAVAALALLAAVVVPGLVTAAGPRLAAGPGAWQGWGGLPVEGGSGGARVDPVVDLVGDLGERSDTMAFTYRAVDGTDAAAQPFRVAAVDVLEDGTWRAREDRPPPEPLEGTELPEPPGLDVGTAVADGVAVRQRLEVTVGALRQESLPLPYPVTTVDLGDDAAGWLLDGTTLDVVGADGTTTTQDQRYTVDALRLRPTADDLVDGGTLLAGLAAEQTELPDDLPPDLVTEAREVAGEGEPLQQATRLQAWFRSEGDFTYSEQAPGGTGTDSVGAFLERRSGYCVHFASTMALMARAVGLPARVAVGFLPGERMEDGGYRVLLSDAHAWPEIYLAGAGWVRFEPTPSIQTGEAPPWTEVAAADAAVERAAQREEERRAQADDPAAPQPAPSTGATGPDPRVPEGEAGTPGSTGADATAADAVPVRALLVPAVALLVLLAAPSVVAAVARRRRWGVALRRARAGDGTALVGAAEDELRARVADLGAPVPVAATPRRQERRLLAVVGVGAGDVRPEEGPVPPSEDGRPDAAPDAALARLRADLEAARYRPGGGAVAEAATATAARLRRDVDVVVDAVAATVPRARRLRARLLPAVRPARPPRDDR